MILRNWKRAEQLLLQMADDVSRLPFSSFQDDDICKLRKVESPLPGIQFEVDTSWMLNGSWTACVEAESSYFFGLVYRSIYTLVEVSPDGGKSSGIVVPRLEFFRTRMIRRNWSWQRDQET